jgi:predicted DNA-binding protein
MFIPSSFAQIPCMAGIGKDSENLSVNVPATLMRKLEALAAADHRTKSNYCRMLLEEHVKQAEMNSRLGKIDSAAANAAELSTRSTVRPASSSRETKPGLPGGGLKR